MNDRDRNCLSHWFPLLQGAGLPVPRTEIVRTSIDLAPLCDGVLPADYWSFIGTLRDAAQSISPDGPWFLRTGQGSGKHDWRHCCDLRDLDQLSNQVVALVEWSHTVDLFGLIHDVWAVRERLPVKPIAILPRYGDMPLVREVRGFVRDGLIECVHPYWPAGAIRQGFGSGWGPADLPRIVEEAHALTLGDLDEINRLLLLAAGALPGYWSVDLLATDRGWYVTDAALGEMSFHWDGCQRKAVKP